MRGPLLFISALLFVSVLFAQETIRQEIRSLPSFPPPGTAIYAAGSFNGWNPRDEDYKFKQDEHGNYFLDLKLNAGSYEYKITRGGWDKVECQKNGKGIGNRQLQVEGAATAAISVEEWQDNISVKPKTSTAGKNVRIADTAFFIPQLNRVRRIWIYLPANYSTTTSRYPVLYMHDGQNVFEDTSSYAGEWGVDEYLDTTLLRTCLVVAIDNGGVKRLNEYSPYDFSLPGIAATSGSAKGEGRSYVDFIVHTLKPFIDRTYRTEKDKKNTFIAGSSMGGLISLYAVLKYPKVFGGAGIFSPAFWIAPGLLEEIRRKGKKVNSLIYFYAGKQESESMVPDMLKAFEGMMKVSRSGMTTVIRNDGKHNEATWRNEFPLFYYWIMSRGRSTVDR